MRAQVILIADLLGSPLLAIPNVQFNKFGNKPIVWNYPAAGFILSINAILIYILGPWKINFTQEDDDNNLQPVFWTPTHSAQYYISRNESCVFDTCSALVSGLVSFNFSVWRVDVVTSFTISSVSLTTVSTVGNTTLVNQTLAAGGSVTFLFPYSVSTLYSAIITESNGHLSKLY